MSASWTSWNLLGLHGLRRVGRPHNNLDDTETTAGHLLAGDRTESLSLDRATRSRHRLDWMSSRFHEAIEEAFLAERWLFLISKWMSGAHCMTLSVISLSMDAHYMTLSVISLSLIDGIQEGVSSNNEFECSLRPR
jgi:hypothetical protein